MTAVLNPKLLILAVALFGAGCMTNDNATDLIGTSAVPVVPTEIAGNHSIFVATTREASADAKVFDQLALAQAELRARQRHRAASRTRPARSSATSRARPTIR